MTKHQILVTDEEMEKWSHRAWWSQRTFLKKSLIVGSFVVLLVTEMLASTVGVLAERQNEVIVRSKRYSIEYKQTTRENVCQSTACLEEAARITKYMDASVDPCVNFYQYACGGYPEKTMTVPDKGSSVPFHIVNEQQFERFRGLVHDLGDDVPLTYRIVKDYYKACMNTDLIDKRGVKPMKTLLKKLGGWPMVEGADWNPAGFETFKSASRFQKLGFSNSFLMTFYVNNSFSNSSNYMTMSEPYLGMPSRDYYLKGFDDPKVQAYYNYMVSLAELLGADRKRAMEEGKKAILLETEIAKAMTRPEDRQNKLMTFAEMYEQFPDIPWFQYVQDIMPITIHYTDSLFIPSLNYIRDISSILMNTPKRDIANYMMWRIAKGIVVYMPDDVSDLHREYNNVIFGDKKRLPRWKECTYSVTSIFPIIVGSMYVKKYFDPEAKEQAEEILKYVKRVFHETLENVDWMDPKTKGHAFEKLKSMNTYIGYHDDILDDDKLYEAIEGLEISPDDSLKNILNVGRYYIWRNHVTLREPGDKMPPWSTPVYPTSTAGFYDLLENNIKFSASILQGIIFNKNRPNYLNFGATGWRMGREIPHGFYSKGRHYDKNGKLNSWWSPKTNEIFLEKTKCMIEQYGNFTLEQIGKNVNGTLTLDENIADNGGVKLAYNAYLQWVENNGEEPLLPGIDLNQQQLLWLSGAHVYCGKQRPEIAQQVLTNKHSPPIATVNVVYQNSESFAKDFNCPLGSRMNPKHKCAIW